MEDGNSLTSPAPGRDIEYGGRETSPTLVAPQGAVQDQLPEKGGVSGWHRKLSLHELSRASADTVRLRGTSVAHSEIQPS